MQIIRGYNTHQRTDRVDASVRQPHDVCAASIVNPYLKSAVLTSGVLCLYLFIMGTYKDADWRML
jgi:hypothetical protein